MSRGKGEMRGLERVKEKERDGTTIIAEGKIEEEKHQEQGKKAAKQRKRENSR